MEGTYSHLVDLIDSLQREAGLAPDDFIVAIYVRTTTNMDAPLLKYKLCQWVVDECVQQRRDPQVPFQVPHYIKLLGTPVVIKGAPDPTEN